MSLYTVIIANDFDETTKVVLVLSNEPLDKYSSTLNNGNFIKLYENESIYKVEKSKVIVNAWSQNEFDELEEIKKSYISLSKSVNKAAKSNNNMLPKSQRLTGNFTNQDVLDRMGELDNEINEAELQFSKNAAPKLDKEFNDIINNRTGIDPDKTSASIKSLKK